MRIISQYKKLEKHIFSLIFAELFIQMINSAFLLIMLVFMQKEGYSDHQSADFISYRFLGTLLLAFPMGLFIKGRKIKPVFIFASLSIPIFSLLIVYGIHYHVSWLLYVSQVLWGIGFLCFQITALPFILRNAKQDTHTEAISLSFATYSFGGISSGVLIFLLSTLNPVFFDEMLILQIIAGLGFISIFFIMRIDIEENITEEPLNLKKLNLGDFDWKIIAKAMFPVFVIATGAGLTIPFIGIFFFNVHGVDSHEFAIYGSISAVLVAIGALLVPQIKARFGYMLAVPATQTVAVLALVVLATTELFAAWALAVPIAILCYVIRQPLMNMAGPMTSEVMMNYVGPKNREITSALTSTIWSGSWYISSRIFKILRENGIAYVKVFMITAVLYGLGIFLYYLVMLDYEKRLKSGLIKI
ncbi:MAG: MFS transporter [Bacteroidetes bacterium]|nr:MFS transporter [Bacteroidota bacterium]HET6245112.1 MFS transporter [Bacteroidia bacterium]